MMAISISSCTKDSRNRDIIEYKNVQTLLDDGFTPINLFNRGFPLDSLYGKMYRKGLIFYLDTIKGTGMVATPEDHADRLGWSESEFDRTGLNNVKSWPTQPETEVGARIGDGAINTDIIIKERWGDAAIACRNLGPEWFLPSRGELNMMYQNLAKKGHGGFVTIRGNGRSGYWSSTEEEGDLAWGQFFSTGVAIPLRKSQLFNPSQVRAARAF